jgi:hypothetical protein
MTGRVAPQARAQFRRSKRHALARATAFAVQRAKARAFALLQARAAAGAAARSGWKRAVAHRAARLVRGAMGAWAGATVAARREGASLRVRACAAVRQLTPTAVT